MVKLNQTVFNNIASIPKIKLKFKSQSTTLNWKKTYTIEHEQINDLNLKCSCAKSKNTINVTLKNI